MALSDIITITISVQAAAVSRAGFGVPLICSYHTYTAGRVATYTSLAGLVTAGFATTDATYLAANALLAQSPKVTSFKVGRRALPFTQIIRITPSAPSVAKVVIYTVTIAGTAFAFTSDATPTVAEVTAGLTALINAGAVKVTASDDTTHITITATTVAGAGAPNDPGALYTYEVSDNSDGETLLARQDMSADPGIATDLANIIIEDNDWYGLIIDNQSENEINAAAAWVETATKLFGATTGDSIVPTVDATDVASDLNGNSYHRTYTLYDEHPHDYGAAAWMGLIFAGHDPGSATWKFKTLVGVTKRTYDATQIGYLDSKKCNYYSEVGGVGITQEGYAASGRFMDITRGVDWLQARMQERIFSRLVNLAKIPFTDAGIAVVEAEVRGQLDEGIDNLLLASDPEPTVTVPLAADVSSANKATRLLPDVEFTATLAGAIHNIEIAGVVSV